MKKFTKILVLLVFTATLGAVQSGWSQIASADVDLSGIVSCPWNYTPDNPDLSSGILFDNGPVYNSAGTGAGGANESIYYQGGTATYGSGCQHASGIYVADDFTVPTGMSWAMTSVDFYAYQTNSTTTSTITGIYMRIWSGKPGVAGSVVVWGDMTTNRMSSTSFANIYRVLAANGGIARPVMKVEVGTTGLLLGPGSYWAEFACTGSLTSGPWMPPVVTAENVTGNGIQTVDAGVTYSDIIYNSYAQGCPFVIYGSELSSTIYYNYNTNGSNNSFPLNIAGGKEVQLLFGPGEFSQPSPAPAGNISGFSFRIADSYPLGPWTYTDLTIKMGQSAITQFTSGAFYSPLTTVYSRASVTLTGVPGQWMTIPLDTPLPYDPSLSLIVDVGHCGAPGASGFSMCFTNNPTELRRNWSVAGCPFVYSASNFSMFHVGLSLCPQPSISGAGIACSNSIPYDYSTDGGMTGYNWSVSPGNVISGGQGTSLVQVLWMVPGPQWVAVSYDCVGGSTSQTVYNVSVNPPPSPTIEGPATLCTGSTGNIYTTQQGMSSYVWTVSPGNIITEGQGTRHATITWAVTGAQWIEVNYTDANGCIAAVPGHFDVTANPLPQPTLNGPTSACAGSSGHVYSTQAGMSDYYWLTSSGGTITSGGTTTSNTATVTWNTPGAQLVYVNYANAFGCYAAVPTTMNVDVNPVPPTPVITLTGNVLSSNAPQGNQWYLNGTVIPGANTQYYTPVSSGNYSDMVTLDGCSSQMSNVIAVVVSDIGSTGPTPGLSISPNPSNGSFTLTFAGENTETADLRILNLLGLPVYKQSALEVNGTLELEIDLSSIPRGIYSVVLSAERRQFIQKIVIR